MLFHSAMLKLDLYFVIGLLQIQDQKFHPFILHHHFPHGTWETMQCVLGVSSICFFLAVFLTWPLHVTLGSCTVKEQSDALQLCKVWWKCQANRFLGQACNEIGSSWLVQSCFLMLAVVDMCLPS